MRHLLRLMAHSTRHGFVRPALLTVKAIQERSIPLCAAGIGTDVCSAVQHRKRIEHVHHRLHGCGYMVCNRTVETKQLGYSIDGIRLYTYQHVAVGLVSGVSEKNLRTSVRAEGVAGSHHLAKVVLRDVDKRLQYTDKRRLR